jgi:hypothetical protein
VISGRWKLRISKLPKDTAVVDVQQSGASIYEDGLTVEDKSPEPVQVLLSPAGYIDGTVRDSDGRPVPGAIVFLTPSPQNQSFAALYQNAEADASGRFMFASVAEGDYRLYSFETSGPIKESLPRTGTGIRKFLGSYIDQGSVLHVQQGVASSIDLRKLPN